MVAFSKEIAAWEARSFSALPGRRKGAAGQVVLEVNHPVKLALADQGQAENGAGLPFPDVGVLAKCGLGRGIVENDSLPGAQDVVEHRFWQHSCARLLVAQLHCDRVAAGCGFRLYPLLDPSRTNQQTSLGAGLLDRGAHEHIDQSFKDDLARDRLRHLDRRREIEVNPTGLALGSKGGFNCSLRAALIIRCAAVNAS